MKSRAKIISLLIFCLALLVWFNVAQASYGERLPFKNYTTAEGLAHDFVGKIVKDSRGFLWFCTGEGLSRFDGYEFKNYTQAHGLPHRSINDLLELNDGTYLVATNDGLAFFNPKAAIKPTDETRNPKSNTAMMFRTFRVPSEMSDQRPVNISALLKTRSGQIWATSEIGLFKILSSNNDWQFEKAEIEAWRGKRPEISSIAEDRFGRLWLGTGIGLFVFNSESGEAFQVLQAARTSIVEDNQGRMWAGSGPNPINAGLYLFDVSDNHRPPILLRRFTTADGLTDDIWIHSLFKTSDGRILAGIRSGLSEFLPEAKPGEPSFRTLFMSDIISVGEDAGSNLWVGTATRGAFKLTRRGFVIYQVKEKLPYTGITSIFAGNGNEIFITSSSKDLLYFDGEKFSELQLVMPESRSWGFSQIDFRSRKDGEWWIPSTRGLVRYPAVKRFEDLAQTHPKKIYTTRDGLFSNEVFRLFEDSRGDIWFSVIGPIKNTLMRWERNNEKFYGYTSLDGLPETNAPTAFAEDSQGSIWLGFYGGNAARYRNGKFHIFSNHTGFPTGFVSAIYCDISGRIWIATSNSGVIRFDNPQEDEPRYTVLNVGNGLSSNQANCITEDNFGRIYVGTARGINRIEPETGRIKLYTQADGLPGNAISRCTRGADGNLWFTQKFHLARLNVQADEKAAPPPVFIAEMRVNGEPINNLSELGETSIEGLEFNSEQRQIQIEFFALGFSTGENLRYQYKFDNTNWSEPSAQRIVNLNMSPGNYNFRVRAINADGIASETPASVTFSIARPVWQRWWFLLLTTIFVSCLIYLIYHYRLKRLLELERVRTRIATDLHDDIGASLTKIAILSEVAGHRIAPIAADNKEITETLEHIAGVSREMVDSMSDIVWAINPSKDHLSDMIGRMRNLAGEMTELRDIGLHVHLVGIENADLHLGADLRREIYLIFKETLNNLVKHSGCSLAEIEFRLAGNNLFVVVKDNGRGFDASADKSNGNRGGNGLVNMKRRAAALGGSYKIESQNGKGTNAVLIVPIKRGMKKLKPGFLFKGKK